MPISGYNEDFELLIEWNDVYVLLHIRIQLYHLTKHLWCVNSDNKCGWKMLIYELRLSQLSS